jgi:ribosomal protein L24
MGNVCLKSPVDEGDGITIDFEINCSNVCCAKAEAKEKRRKYSFRDLLRLQKSKLTSEHKEVGTSE